MSPITDESLPPSQSPTEAQVSNNRQIAFKLARQGHHVFPCRERAGANGKEKTPLCRWRDQSTTNEDQIKKWWSIYPNAAAGLDLGKSGLLVIDCDRHNDHDDGVTAFAALMDKNGFDPDTCPIVATPNNGLHFYFKLPDGEDHGNGRGDLPDGIDVRGNGGYVIAGETVMADGRFYELVGDISSAPVVPDWLWTIIKADKKVDMPDASCSTAQPCAAPPETSGANTTNILNGANLGELEELLMQIPSDCGYDEWHKCLMAVHAATGGSQSGFNLVDNWSAKGSKYEGSKKLQKKWASFKSAGINSQSLASIAKRYGADLKEIALKHNNIGRVSDEEIQKSAEIANALYQKHLDEKTANINKVEEVARQSIFSLGEHLEFKYEPELIRDMIPTQGVGFLGGQSGAGKTFLSVELAYCIAMGLPFTGHTIDRQGGVLVVLYEGAGTIHNRVIGWRRNKLTDSSAKAPVFCTASLPLLADEAGFRTLLAAGREATRGSMEGYGLPLRLIIIDTVTASGAIGSDKENDPASWQKYLDEMQAIARELSCTVMLVHHYGKSSDAGLRGSSAARAAGDFVLAITCDRDEITGDVSNRKLALTKSRSGIEGPIGNVDLDSVEVGKRDDGSPVTTVTLSITKPTKSAGVKKPAQKVSGGMVIFKLAFYHVFPDKAKERPAMGRPENPTVQMVPVSAVRDEFFVRHGSGEADPDKRKDAARKSFGRQVKAAMNHGFVVANIDDEEWIWTQSND